MYNSLLFFHFFLNDFKSHIGFISTRVPDDIDWWHQGIFYPTNMSEITFGPDQYLGSIP